MASDSAVRGCTSRMVLRRSRWLAADEAPHETIERAELFLGGGKAWRCRASTRF